MPEASSTFTPGASELPSDTHAAPDLRAEFVEAQGPRVYLVLCGVGTMFLLPFSANSFLHGRTALGIATCLVALGLIGNAVAIFRGKAAPFPPVFIFAPSLAALLAAMIDQGLIGILWAYAAILLFHFVLPLRTANIFNAIVVLLAVPIAWYHVGPEVTARIAVTLVLTVLFTNAFSAIADMRRRKEAEQRHRLDLLVRGTNAGILEWSHDGRVSCSRRLLQMLGRSRGDAPTSGWDFLEYLHPDDRDQVQGQVLEQFRTRGPARRVVHLPPADLRLLHASGSELWVHTEAICVTDAGGRTRRYICSFMDVTDWVHAQHELLRSHDQVREQARRLELQNDQLREAIRVREEVERIARHDLKAPLSSIAAVPRLLRESGRPAGDDEELLAMVEQAALRVLSMVNLSLDLHRMEEGSYRGRSQAVDLAALTRTVLRELGSHAASKQVGLSLDVPPERAVAEAEELLCYSILANLVKNAIEAAPEGSSVQLALVPAESGQVTLTIRNQGAVPLPIRESFFRKYATHGKAGGTGLGAYSARLMARVQQGDLDMATDDATGTTLTLRLPAWNGPLPTAATTIKALVPAPARAPAPGAVPGGLSVLLVDDDPHNILVLRRLLPGGLGLLRDAVNGRAACERVREARPDLVFLDLQMPVMDGLEAAGEIRRLQAARGESPSVLVAFSARDDEASRTACAAAGFDHYLVKPATREEILALVNRVAPPRAVPGAPVAPLPMDPDIIGLLPSFVASRRQLLRQLQEAPGRGDRTLVRSLAHTLAGSLAMYGFEASSALSRGIMAAAPAEDFALLQQRCDALVDRFEREQAEVVATP
jgi:CheY-like chemotaxis protein/PAS domain-containing protein/HPt (histidine-containing phosphotransfer) domain-containing protein